MDDQSGEMMDDFDRWAIRIFKAVAALFILTLSLLAIAMCVDNGDMMRHRPPIIQPSGAEKRWLNERFKIHGISACIEENGERYFYRDGKKCKL